MDVKIAQYLKMIMSELKLRGQGVTYLGLFYYKKLNEYYFFVNRIFTNIIDMKTHMIYNYY